jgi:predicted dehydrogenase
MATSELRVGLAGCGFAAQVHLDRLLGIEGVRVVGCADPDLGAARALAGRVAPHPGEEPPAVFADHRELLRNATPDALGIFTPHLGHYRPTMDALQAGCHVFVEKPLTTNVQEAVDIVSVAKGRGLKVGVGHQFRLCPSLAEVRRRLAAGAIGAVRLVTATLAEPWLDRHQGAEHAWRFDPRISGGGILADAGEQLLDALLWTTGQVAFEAAAIQARLDSGADVVTAAAVRLGDGTPATVAISGVSPGALFELNYFGARGQLRATDTRLVEELIDHAPREVELAGAVESIDGNFVSAVVAGTPLCCPAAEALDSVRLLDAIARSAATGQVVRLA